jgi:hypothetical protein
MQRARELLLLGLVLATATELRADQIAAADLQIQGVGLKVITVSATTGLNIPATIQTEFGGKQNDEAPVVEGLLAVGDLTGPGIDAPIRLETAPGRKFQIPGLQREGVYFLQNIRLMKGTEFLQPATPAVASITVSNLLQTSVRVRQLTPEEIRARGISIDARNYDVYEYTFSFLVGEQIVEIPFPVIVDPRTHEVRQVPQVTPWTLPPINQIIPPRWQPPEILTFEMAPPPEELPDEGPEAPAGGGGGRISIPAAIVIPNNLAVLHQFFAVTLMVTNGAPSGSEVTLDDITALIKPPAPLRTVKSMPSVAFNQPVPIVDANTGVTFLVAQARGEAEWTMEGLQPGTHTVEIDVRATYKSPGQADFPLKGTARASVVVHDPRFNITFSHPDTVRKDIDYSTYSFITNMSGAAQTIKVTNGVPACAEAPGANVCRVDGTPASHDLTIPPGEMRSIEYTLRPGITGFVFATAGSVSDDNITASVQLHMGVSESGIPLSPATLVMPYYAQFVAQPMVSANLQLLGLGYSLATAPLTSALAKHPRVIKTDVFHRATDIARAGQRRFLGEPMRETLAHMILDLLGNANELREWDELRRAEKSGRIGAASIAREFEANLGSATVSEFAAGVASITAWRPPYLLAVSTKATLSVRDVTSNARLATASEAESGWVRQLPFAELNTFQDGELAVVGRWSSNYEVMVTPKADGPFTLDVILPAAADGSVLRGHFDLTGTAGKSLTLLVTRGAANLELRDALGGIAQTVPTIAVSPEPLQIVGARQDLHLDDSGHKVSILWNRAVAVAAGEDLLQKFAAQVTLNRDGVSYQGPRPLSAAALQEPPRIVNVTFDHALSTNATYSIAISPLRDPLSGAPVSFPNPVEPVIDNDRPGAILYGQVLKGDNTPIAEAEVRLFLQDLGAGPPQYDFSRAGDGAFLFEYVPRDADNGLNGSYKLEAVTTDLKETSVEGAVRLPGRVHRVNLVFLGRGSAEGVVRYNNGEVVADAKVVIGSTMFGTFRTQQTDANGRYSITDLPVGPLTFSAADNDGNITFAASEIKTPGEVVVQDLSIFRRPFPGTGTIRGIVKRSDTNTPVPFAQLGVYSQGYGVLEGFSDSTGRFEFSRVPIGFITVLAAEWSVSREAVALDFDLAANEVRDVTMTLNVKPADPLVVIDGDVIREDPLFPGDASKYQRVPGAIVKIDKGQAVTADANGHFVISSVPVSFTGKDITAYDPITKRSATIKIPQLNAAGTNSFNIFISTANGYGKGTIRVRLLSATGTPVNGYRVIVPGFPPFGPTPLNGAPNGIYTLEDVPVGAVTTIWAIGNGSAPYFDQYISGTTKVEFNGHVAAMTLRLPGQGSVRVKLVADIDVIGDVEITYPAWDEADQFPAPKKIKKSTSENGLAGYATFSGISALTDYTVTSAHPIYGFSSRSGKLGFEGDVHTIDLQLGKLATVSGVVYAIDGRTPVPGAAVRIEDGRQNQGVQFTLPDGSYIFRNVAAGVPFRVLAEITQEGVYRTGVASGGTPALGGVVDNVAVILRTQGGIDGRIVYKGYRVFDPQNAANNVVDTTPEDLSDNAPVPLAQFTLRELDFPYRNFGTTADPLTADVAGRFTINNVFTGPLRATAYDPGNQEIRGAWTGQIAQEGEQITALIGIGAEGFGPVVVRVLDPNAQNAPVVNAEVSLIRGFAPFDFATTDGNGTVRFEQVPVGSYRVSAYSKALGKSGGSPPFNVANVTGAQLDVVLEFSGKVDGVLTDPEAGGAGVPGVPVTLTEQTFQTRASTDTAGAFVFNGVREGLFKLDAKDTQSNRRASAQRTLTQANPNPFVPLELEPIETLYLSVYLPNDSGGNSNVLAPIVTLDVRQRSNDFMRSLQGNQFQMTGLFENEVYGIYVREVGGAGREIHATGRFPQGSASDPLKLVLPAYGTVEVRVTQGATPTADARVTISAGGKSVIVYTDDAGIAVANGIRLGAVYVQVSTADGAFSGSANATLSSQSTPLVVPIVLGAYAGITGLVEAETGGPSVGTRVIAAFSGRFLEMLTDSNGRYTFQGIPTSTLVNLTYMGPDDVTVGARQPVTIGAGDASRLVPAPTVRLDATPPRVDSIFPADGAANVSPDSSVRIVFSERVAPQFVNTSYLKLLPADSSVAVPTTFASILNPDGTFTVTMTPPPPPPGQQFPLRSNTLYRVTIAGEITDMTGNKLPAPRGASFITSDYAEPKVMKVIPPVTAALQPATTFEFRFNEPIDPAPWQPGGTGQFLFYKVTAPNPSGTIIAAKPGRAFLDPASSVSLFFAPDDAIEQESFYRIIFSGLRDLQGNVLAPQTFHFFSYDLVKPFATLISPVPDTYPLISGVEYTLTVDIRNLTAAGSPATDVAKVDYFRVDGTNPVYIATANALPWSYRFVAPDAPPGGIPLTLRAVVTDLSGNESDPASITWQVNPNLAPQNVTVTMTPPAAIYPGNHAFAAVTFQDEGTLATVQVEATATQTDGSEYKTSQVKQVARVKVDDPWAAAHFDFDLPPTLRQGTRATFTANVTDVRGLKGTGSAQLDLTTDATAPEIINLTPAAQTPFNIGQKYQIVAIVKDLETGPAEVTFSFDNRTITVRRPSALVTSAGDRTWAFSSGDITVPAKNVDTTIAISATAKDYNSNVISRSTEVVYVGVNDPTVPKGAWLCPIERAAYPGGQSLPVKLQVRATDDIAVTGVKFEVPGIATPIDAARVGTSDVYEATPTITFPAAGETLTLRATISDANPAHDIVLEIPIDAVAIDITINDFIQAVTPADAPTYLNKSVLVRGAAGRLIPHVPLTLANLIVLDGARVETLSTTTTVEQKLDLTIPGRLYVDCASRVDVSGRGYLGGWGINDDGSGTRNNDARGRTVGNTNTDGAATFASASHAGLGGERSTGVTNPIYGSLTDPVELGAGGGGGTSSSNAGGSGGGAIKVSGTGIVAVAGAMRADGAGRTGDGNPGAGGSINIRGAQFIAGPAARITANGGDDDADAAASRGAGGGRIAIAVSDRLEVETLGIQLQARGGRNGTTNEGPNYLGGGAGTIYLRRPGQTLGELFIGSFDERFAATNHLTRPTPLGGLLRFDRMAVGPRALARADASLEVNGIVDSKTAATVDPTGVLILNGEVPAITVTTTPAAGGSLIQSGTLTVSYAATSAAGVGVVTTAFSPITPDRVDPFTSYPVTASAAPVLTIPATAAVGTATLTLSAGDRAGRGFTLAPLSYSIVANAPPVIDVFDVLPPAVYPGRSIASSVTARDDLKVTKLTYTRTIGTGTPSQSIFNPNTPTFSQNFNDNVPITTPGGQTMTFELAVEDGFPGRSATTQTKSVTILRDSVPPEVFISTPTANQLFQEGSGNTFQVRATITDADVGVKEAFVQIDNGAPVPLTKSANEYVATIPVPSVDGTEIVTKTLTVTGKDYEGNPGTSSVTIRIQPVVDPNGPVISWTCPSANGIYPAGFAARLRVFALGNSVGNTANGVQKIDFYVDDATTPITTTTPVSGLANHYEVTYAIPADAAAGRIYSVRAVATNVAGSSEGSTTTFTIVAGSVITANTTISATDTSYDNLTVIVQSGTTTIAGAHTFANLIVVGGKVTHTSLQRLDLTVTGTTYVSCDGAIDASDQGYGLLTSYPGVTASTATSAGSHIGRGGMNSGVSGATFGSIYRPQEHGGGAAQTGLATGGGGVVKLTTATANVDGAIRANGKASMAAAGGSVWLVAQHVAGKGRIEANGSSGGSNAGGGGAIAVEYSGSFASTVALSAFTNNAQANQVHLLGGAGSIYLKGPSSTYGDLVIDNGGIAGQTTVLPSLGQGTAAAGSAGASLVLPSAPLPFFAGHWVEISTPAGVLKGTWRISAIDGATVTLAPNGSESVDVAAGDTYQGVYRFDTVRANNGEPLRSADPIRIGVNGVIPLTGPTAAGKVLEFAHPFSGASVTVTGNIAAPAITATGIMTVKSGARLTPSTLATNPQRIDINAGTLDVEATAVIDVSGRGFNASTNKVGQTWPNVTPSTDGAGGSHGGRGGGKHSFAVGDSGGTYGSPFDPDTPGGAGASRLGSCSVCGAGGGVARIQAGTFILNGQVLSNGTASNGTASGAGGSIRVDANSLSGTGAIRAEGRGRIDFESAGGGGRIAIYYGTLTLDRASISAAGGAHNDALGIGSAGTVFLKGPGSVFGELIVDNGGRNSSKTTPLPSVGYATVSSFGTDTVTDTSAQLVGPDHLRGVRLVLNYDRSTTWPIVANTQTELRLDVSGAPLTAQSGQPMRGLYRFDRLELRNTKLETKDLLEVTAPIDSDAASSILGNNQAPPQVNPSLVALTSAPTGSAVVGSSSAVTDLDGTIALATNVATGNVYQSGVNTDGSFTVPVQGSAGDAVTLRVRDTNYFPLESPVFPIGTLQTGTPVPSQIPKSEWTTDANFLARTLSADGGHLVVSGYPAGNGHSPRLTVLSILDPAHPAFLRTVDAGVSTLFDAAVSNGWAYIAGDRLATLNLNDPAAVPNLANRNEGGWESSVAVSGGYAFTSEYDFWNDGRIHIYDVSTPSSPRYIRTQAMSATRDLRFTDLLVYGDSYLIGLSHDGRDVMVIDKRDIYGLRHVATLDVADFVAFRGYIVGTNLYLVSRNVSDLVIVSLAAPASPSVLGRVRMPATAAGVTVRGSDGFVADGTAGLVTINISAPSLPAISGSTAVGGNAYDTLIIGQYAYVANELGLALVPAGVAPNIDPRRISMSLNGTVVAVTGAAQAVTGAMPIALEVVNASTGASVSGLQVLTDGSFTAMLPAAAGNRITVKATDSFARVNGPLLIGTVPFGAPATTVVISPAMADAAFLARNVSVHGNRAVVASYPPANSDKLVVFDVTTPAAPGHLRTVPSAASTVWDVTVREGWLFFAADRFGSLNLSDPNATPNLANRNEGGWESAVEIVDGYAFTAEYDFWNDGRIHIYDVITPSAPRYLRTQAMSATRDLRFTDLVAYGTDYLIGVSPDARDVTVIDRRNISALRVVANFDIPGFQGYFGKIVGTDLYVAGVTGLAVVDLSNPAAPRNKGVLSTPGAPRGFDVLGTTVATADGSAGVTFLDSTPAELPVILGSQGVGGSAWETAFNGATLYVANEAGLAVIDRFGAAPLIDRSRIITSSNGANTATVTGSASAILGLANLTAELRNATTGVSVAPIAVAADGSFNAGISAMSGHLLTLRATDGAGRTAGPVSLGTVPFGSATNHVSISTAMTDGGFLSRVVAAGGDRAVVTSYPDANSDKLVIFDVSTPGNATHLRTVPSTASTLWDVKVRDGWAYFSADRLGTLDLLNPAAVPNLADRNEGGWESSIEIVGGYAFTSEYDWWNDARIHVYDVSTPSQPRYLRTQAMSPTRDQRFSDLVAWGDNYLIGISPDARDVMVIDRSDIQVLKRVSNYDIPGFTGFRGAVLGNRLYVAGVNGGVAIVDLSNPAAPALVQIVTSAGAARAIEIAGSTLAVANGTNGVSFIDVSTAPVTLLGSHVIPGSAWDVALSRGAMYVAGELGLTSVANVALPPMLDESKLTITPAATDTIVTGSAQALTGIAPITARINNVATGSTSPPAAVNANGSFGATVPAQPGQTLSIAATDAAGRVTTRALPPTHGAITTHLANQIVTGDSAFHARSMASDGSISVASGGSYANSGFSTAATRGFLFRQPNASEAPRVVDLGTGGVHDVEIGSGYLYVAGGRFGVVNLADPTLTTKPANVDQSGGETGIVISGQYAFTGELDWWNDGRIHIYNVSNPDAPTYLRTQAMSATRDLNFRALVTYGASYLIGISPNSRDVMVIDRTNINSLMKVYELSIPNFDAYDGVVDGTTLYVAGGNGGLAIVDLTNPLAPVLRSTLSMPNARAVAISGPNEVVLATGSGLTFVNVADKVNPLIIGSQPLIGNVVDVKVVGRGIYVAADNYVHIVMRP